VNNGTAFPESVRVLSVPPGRVQDPRSALELGGGIHRSELWAGFAPAALLPDPDWVEEPADEFDVAHLHLGLSAMSSVALFHLIVRLRACAKPVVLTVHNLEHPCVEQALLDELLRVAVPSADEIVTFTVGAGREILRRWGRAAHILPHPPVILDEPPRAPRAPGHGFVVGIAVTQHCGLAEPWETVEAAARALHGSPDSSLRVLIDPALVAEDDSSPCPTLRERARELASLGVIELSEHEQLGVHELAAFLRGLDAFVVPRHRASHSSWIEACYDVATTVITPDRGFYREQRTCLTYPLASPDGLDGALRTARRMRRDRTAPVDELAAELEFIVRAHRELYLSLIDAAAGDSPSRELLAT